MRAAVAVAVLLAAPAARADLHLALLGTEATVPTLSLGVPELSLDTSASPTLALATDLFARESTGAARARVEPVLCLVLGIIPGFGIGHALAGSRNWVIWLVVDIAIAIVFWGPYWYWPGHPGYFPFLNILVLVERIFEGISAYQAAGGGRILPLDRAWAGGFSPPALAALPVGSRPGVSW